MTTLFSAALACPLYLRDDILAARDSSSTTLAAPPCEAPPKETVTGGLRAAFLNQSLSGLCREK